MDDGALAILLLFLLVIVVVVPIWLVVQPFLKSDAESQPDKQAKAGSSEADADRQPDDGASE